MLGNFIYAKINKYLVLYCTVLAMFNEDTLAKELPFHLNSAVSMV